MSIGNFNLAITFLYKFPNVLILPSNCRIYNMLLIFPREGNIWCGSPYGVGYVGRGIAERKE